MSDTDHASADGRGPSRFRVQALKGRALSRDLGPVVTVPSSGPASAVRNAATGATSLRDFFAPRRRVPVLLQSHNTECGPAALAMTLAHHGRDVGVKRLSSEMDVGRDGLSARQLLDAARRHGLMGRGVRTGLQGLRSLPTGSILFWEFRHFVVLERVSGDHVYLVDPAAGRRRLPLAVVDESFTGVALEFQPALAGAAVDVAEADRESPGVWRRLLELTPHSRHWAVLIVTSIALLTFNPLLPLATGYVVEHAAAGRAPVGPNATAAALVALVVAFLGLQASRQLSILALQALLDKHLTVGLLRHLLSLPYPFFANRSPGDLVLRVRTSNVVRNVLTAAAISAAFDGVLVLIYSTLLVLVDRFLASVVIVLGVVQVGIMLIAWRGQRYLSADMLDAQARAQGELTEIVDGVATLKAAGLADRAAERWSHTLADEINARTKSRRHLALWGGAGMTVQFVAPLTVLIIGAARVRSGDSSLGEVVGFTTLAAGVFVPLANLVQAGLQASGLGATLTRLDDIVDAVPETGGTTVLRAGAVRGDIEVSDLGFAYPGARRRALDGISFTASAGSFMVVLGPSGCGKSTLAMILAGLYEPSAGQVTIDGNDLATVERSSLRRTMSFVNQDARLFMGSIRDNIAWGTAAIDQEQVERSARLAGIHGDIDQLPMKYDTLLDAGGAGLSGGQRQRIALARALIHRPRILILDEASSALDPRLEREVFDRLLSLDHTLIVVAHRLTTVTRADTILVLDHGRLVYRGTPAGLDETLVHRHLLDQPDNGMGEASVP